MCIAISISAQCSWSYFPSFYENLRKGRFVLSLDGHLVLNMHINIISEKFVHYSEQGVSTVIPKLSYIPHAEDLVNEFLQVCVP